jgi:hypothetical protein
MPLQVLRVFGLAVLKPVRETPLSGSENLPATRAPEMPVPRVMAPVPVVTPVVERSNVLSKKRVWEEVREKRALSSSSWRTSIFSTLRLWLQALSVGRQKGAPGERSGVVGQRGA